jgi:hypothetical protein
MAVQNLKKPSIEEVIDRGGAVAADKEASTEKDWKQFNIRLRNDLSRQIDQLLLDRPGLSKTVWILESINEKIKREMKPS